MTFVVDASAMVALLADTGSDGAWAEAAVAGHDLAAPHLMPAEVANVLRRNAVSGRLGADLATLAHARLVEARVALFPYAPLARRVWELRDNLSAYDAWYVALAESLDVMLLTLDRKLMQAAGPRCAFAVPPPA